MRPNQHNTTRLSQTTGRFGGIRIVATQSVVVDVQTRNYDTARHLRRAHALANLPLSAAARLRNPLDQAITRRALPSPSANWAYGAMRPSP
jgi:hypothetical protein